MLQNSMDIGGNDYLWRNKPELPAANEENRKLEEMLRQKKIEIEHLKLILENNINKGKTMKEHFNNLHQSLNLKQQLLKSKEHELEMEAHTQKLIERDCSRLEQETKRINQEIKTLIELEDSRKARIAEQTEKKEKLKSAIELDEDSLLNYLEKSAQMEKDNMALLKYASEDDSRINELGLCVEKLSKELHERKDALDEADTEVFIVESELDKMQEEFKNAYNERSKLITNWEKVLNQIQQRNSEIKKLSDYIVQMRDEEKMLKREEKEQLQLLSSETNRNSNLETQIDAKDRLAAKLHNTIKEALSKEEDLRAEIVTVKNVSSYLLYQKQIAENTLTQLKKQLDQKNHKIEDIKHTNLKLEKDIESLNKETFEADYYIKELEKLFQKENVKNLEIQKIVENLIKENLLYHQEIKKIKDQDKILNNQIKNCQADIRNINSKITTVDRLRTKQESEMYEIESNFEKLQRRIKKMIGITNEEEKRKVEMQKSYLLSVLDEKKKSLNMLTEELKIMMEKITVSAKELEIGKKINLELDEKVKSLEFYISNSQKALKYSISRKQEFLVQECFLKFHIKRYKKLLNSKNKSVFTLQKSKTEFETMMKERAEELRNCSALLDAQIRSEEEECSLVKRKYLESEDKMQKLKSKYKTIMDALGVSEPGPSAEAEMLIKAEEEKRDLLFERDQLLTSVFKNEEELSALKNTLWMINTANEQFRQLVYPIGISLEDSEILRNTEEESQALGIKLHICSGELKSLEDSINHIKDQLNQNQNIQEELQDVINDCETKNATFSKELIDIDAKILRAEKNNSRLSLDIKQKDDYSKIEEDTRIHLLREIRCTVSDLLFAATESKSEIASKIEQLFNEAQIPLPARARSSISRSSSLSSLFSRSSLMTSKSKPKDDSQNSTPSSSSSSKTSSRSETISPSIVCLGELKQDTSQSEIKT